MLMRKTTVLVAGIAVGCYLGWRRAVRPSSGTELAPGIVIDPSKARAIMELGREVARAGVEQVLNSRLGNAA